MSLGAIQHSEADGGRRRPFVFNVSGPYGVGKDSLVNAILRAWPGQTHRVGALTTRPVSKITDPNYESVTREEFVARTARGRWIVNYQLSESVGYATSLDEIDMALNGGLTCVQTIFAGRRGAGALREAYAERLLSIGVCAPGNVEDQLDELRRRLLARGRESTDAIRERFDHQRAPIQYVLGNEFVSTRHGSMQVFDHIVINDDFASASEQTLRLFREFGVAGANTSD